MESSMSERPEHRRPRRLAEWINPTAAKKVHSLIDKVYQRKNLVMAWERVKANRGSGGVDGQTLADFEGRLPEEVRAAYKVVAQFDPAVGSVDDLRALLKAESVSRVIFATKHTEFGKLTQLVEECELQGVEAWIWADFIQTQIARPAFDVLGGERRDGGGGEYEQEGDPPR